MLENIFLTLGSVRWRGALCDFTEEKNNSTPTSIHFPSLVGEISYNGAFQILILLKIASAVELCYTGEGGKPISWEWVHCSRAATLKVNLLYLHMAVISNLKSPVQCKRLNSSTVTEFRWLSQIHSFSCVPEVWIYRLFLCGSEE